MSCMHKQRFMYRYFQIQQRIRGLSCGFLVHGLPYSSRNFLVSNKSAAKKNNYEDSLSGITRSVSETM
jgi:hypothetical protein